MFPLKINFYAVINVRDCWLSPDYQHFSTQKFRTSNRKVFVKKEWEFIRGLVFPNKLKYFNILHSKGKIRFMTPTTIKIRILYFIINYESEINLRFLNVGTLEYDIQICRENILP
jgi:hypothetical protein